MMKELLFFLIGILCIWTGCRTGGDPVAEALTQLPADQARRVDSLLQIEKRMRNSGLSQSVVSGVWREIGLVLIDRAPEAGLIYFEKVLEDRYASGNLDEAAELHLFIAAICDERIRDPQRALENLSRAESIWQEANEEFKLAVAWQRKGVIEARLGRFDAGRRLVRQSIDFFQRDQLYDAVPPARYELARVEHLAGNAAQALNALDELAELWRRQGAYPQLTQANNLRLRILVEKEQWAEAASIYADNDSLLRLAKAPWRPRLEFLQLSRRLLEHQGPPEEREKNQRAYDALADSLDAEGLVYFEE